MAFQREKFFLFFDFPFNQIEPRMKKKTCFFMFFCCATVAQVSLSSGEKTENLLSRFLPFFVLDTFLDTGIIHCFWIFGVNVFLFALAEDIVLSFMEVPFQHPTPPQLPAM
jgi:hypothetical protein